MREKLGEQSLGDNSLGKSLGKRFGKRFGNRV